MSEIPSNRAAVGTLIVATSLIQLANGFFGTFISLRVASEDFEVTWAGLVLSAYFAGFTLGALRCGRIIARVGHIRAYAAFAGAVAAATVLMPLWVQPWAWLLLRAAIGFGCAGLFVTAESWLNAKAGGRDRGRIFASYMVGTFIALAIGQILIVRADVMSPRPFNWIVAFFAVALVMVSATRADPPKIAESAPMPLAKLVRIAPVAVTGCAASGIITGAFYALVPAWAQGEGFPRERIAVFMFTAVLGGLAFQVPVGRLSDRMDRRWVVAAICVGLVVVTIGLTVGPLPSAIRFVAPVLLGGLMSSLYPVCVAHAHDRMPADRVVAVSGALILVSGIGSVLGPSLGTRLMEDLGIDGVLYLMAAAAAVATLAAVTHGLTSGALERSERTFEILAPQAAQLAHDSASHEESR